MLWPLHDMTLLEVKCIPAEETLTCKISQPSSIISLHGCCWLCSRTRLGLTLLGSEGKYLDWDWNMELESTTFSWTFVTRALKVKNMNILFGRLPPHPCHLPCLEATQDHVSPFSHPNPKEEMTLNFILVEPNLLPDTPETPVLKGPLGGPLLGLMKPPP